jgi:hypothetical protein
MITLSEYNDDGSSFIDQPPADPFKAEPDSMGLYRIYLTRPTLFLPDDSNPINLTDAPTLEGHFRLGNLARLRQTLCTLMTQSSRHKRA